MPFIGKDWRSPGGLWVRTSSGWRKVSAIRKNLNRHIKKVARERISKPESRESQHQGDVTFSKDDRDVDNLNVHNISKKEKFTDRPKRQYLFVPTKCQSSKQRGKYLTVGEVLCTLDFCTALSDPKRFHYVCKVVEIIIDNYFVTLSGSAVKYFFCILEEAVDVVEKSHNFIHRVLLLLSMTKEKMLANKTIFFGCLALYNCRLHLIELWKKRLQEVELVQRKEDGKLTLEDLPVECQLYLIQCFTDPADVIHISQTNRHFNKVGNDIFVWQNLFLYHFSYGKLETVFKGSIDYDNIDWKAMFRKLMKRYEWKEEYASMLQKCGRCNCIYWQEDGHPCCVDAWKGTGGQQRYQYVQHINLSPKALMSIIGNP